MDLDNINDIEVLRKLAKSGRAKLKKDINSTRGDYTFKKGFWYLVEQDAYGVTVISDDYMHEVFFHDYIDADEYLDR